MRLDEALRRFRDRVDLVDRRQLAASVLGRSTAWVFAHGDRELEKDEADRLQELFERRAAGEPFHYLIGEREFYGRSFRVDPAVLIPRPETEHLVETLLGLGLPECARVIDVGTGSGCIALTLAAERSAWRIIGSDVSDEALAVAESNRATLGLHSVKLARSDLLDGIEGLFDAIVSNPPYVAVGDPHLDQGDLRFEPREALTDGADGLGLIGKLVVQAFAKLNPGGWFWLEHGHDQATAVREMFHAAGFESVESRPDLAGIERISGGRRVG